MAMPIFGLFSMELFPLNFDARPVMCGSCLVGGETYMASMMALNLALGRMAFSARVSLAW